MAELLRPQSGPCHCEGCCFLNVPCPEQADQEDLLCETCRIAGTVETGEHCHSIMAIDEIRVRVVNFDDFMERIRGLATEGDDEIAFDEDIFSKDIVAKTRDRYLGQGDQGGDSGGDAGGT